ncbi:histidine kinase dimerization/phosphoacceptor domain-containing protein [Amycolatopsis sp. NPDC023774]|uniref:histidine kinase dimerization/phosphoacceptor domain-containing protein n=1 Tax=Amycolatopsis sp. NPDC023774 TaxID=3155015 RepID=UPI0033F09FA7
MGVTTQNPTLTIVGVLPLHIAAWALGEFFRPKEQLTDEERLRADLVVSERQAQARAAVAEERTRIARGLHDVLAHSMSVIVLNAEGAKLARHQDPDAVDRSTPSAGPGAGRSRSCGGCSRRCTPASPRARRNRRWTSCARSWSSPGATSSST